MSFRETPSQSYLAEAFTYDADTGKLLWKVRPAHHFPGGRWQNPAAVAAACNKRWAGRSVGVERKGYLYACIDGRMFAVHRLIWKLLYNSEPDEIDHINGDRADNRAANLRSVCKTENCRNQRLRSDNTSGHVGVSWDKRKSRWLAKIVVDGKERHIGSFHRREDAEKARQRTQSQLGFHPNHGRRI